MDSASGHSLHCSSGSGLFPACCANLRLSPKEKETAGTRRAGESSSLNALNSRSCLQCQGVQGARRLSGEQLLTSRAPHVMFRLCIEGRDVKDSVEVRCR